MATGPLSSRRAAEVALSIAQFLEKSHQFETEIEGQHYGLIVHADLKPDHILLIEDGSIRVLDFGIAKALAARTLVTTNKWGSIQYASPERLQSDGHVNEHVDFWSLGVMVFEMIAGFRPNRAYEHNASLLDRAIRKQEARELLPPQTEPAFAAIVYKLLAPQPERRYQTAGAIAADLDAFLRGEPTAAGLEHAHASQETVRLDQSSPNPVIVPTLAGDSRLVTPKPSGEGGPAAPKPVGEGGPLVPQSVPTEPLPRTQEASPVAAASAVAVEAPPTEVPAAAAVPALTRRRTIRFLVLLFFMVIVASEALAFIRAERLRVQVPKLDFSDLPGARAEWKRLSSTPIGLGSARVRQALKGRLTQLADRAIYEYQADAPAVAQAQWEQALRSLDFAIEVAPSSDIVAGKRAYVRGQLSRIANSKRPDEAIRFFRESARLTPAAPDAYLGLATIYAYPPHLDAAAFAQAIRDAELRGYMPGRRVRLWSGDLHMALGERARAEARALKGPERIEQLERAAAAYGKCIEQFDGLHLFNSDANLRTCRRRLAEITVQLPPPPPPAPSFESDGVLREL